MREFMVLAGFLLRFALAFTLLLLPCPPLRNSIHAVFLCEVRLLLGAAFPGKWIQVLPYQDPLHSSIVTRVIVGDLEKGSSDGQASVKVITLAARSLGWI